MLKSTIRCWQYSSNSIPVPRGLWRAIAAAHLLRLQVRIRRGRVYLSLVIVVCCVGTGFATGRSLLQGSPTESVCVCACECASVRATVIVMTLYTYNE
jgi:hypothetical protein